MSAPAILFHAYTVNYEKNMLIAYGENEQSICFIPYVNVSMVELSDQNIYSSDQYLHLIMNNCSKITLILKNIRRKENVKCKENLTKFIKDWCNQFNSKSETIDLLNIV